LLARIYKVLPLVVQCGGVMRIIAFITEGPVIRESLGHLGEPTSPLTLAPTRGPPWWKFPVAGQAEREIDPQAQPAPDYEFDQRIAWSAQKRQRFAVCRRTTRLPAGYRLAEFRRPCACWCWFCRWFCLGERGFQDQFSFDMVRKTRRYF